MSRNVDKSPGDEAVVVIDYTNHRGERRERRVLPVAIVFAESPYHPGRQWILRGMDMEKVAIRDFAMKDIHAWKAP